MPDVRLIQLSNRFKTHILFNRIQERQENPAGNHCLKKSTYCLYKWPARARGALHFRRFFVCRRCVEMASLLEHNKYIKIELRHENERLEGCFSWTMWTTTDAAKKHDQLFETRPQLAFCYQHSWIASLLYLHQLSLSKCLSSAKPHLQKNVKAYFLLWTLQ